MDLCKRPHVVVATPGRLADHVRSSHGVADALRRTRFLVLDEADRMLEPTFENDMATILEVRLPAWLCGTVLAACLAPRGLSSQRLIP